MKTDEKDYYLGNKKLPRSGAKFEWTPAMIRGIKKCSKNLLYFAENYYTIVNLDRGRGKITLYKCQRKVLRALRDNRFNITLASRQVGKTTMMTIYALWIACFQDDQRILIVANKEQTAINIFKRVRLAYEELENWLKPGVEEYGKTAMTLSNGSSIGISTTSSDAGRGDSCNVLILDELAFIDNHLVEEFWKSVYPIISSSKKSKIFIASTPNGTGNLFYDLYENAIKGVNNWKASRIDWHEIPGRDEQWKYDTIRSLGSTTAFDQEFGNKFIESGETVLSEDVIQKANITCEDPKYIFDEGCYHMWVEPDPDRAYVVGVDISEGVGEAASVIQVLDITDLADIDQVAIYHNRDINPHQFTSKLFEILSHWGNPPALIERNNCGAQVVDNLQNIHGYENIVNFSPNPNAKAKYERPGVIAHTNTKYKGVTNMRYWLTELRSVTLRDSGTVDELKIFVRYPNGTWSAQRGRKSYDDRVMALVWALMILENTITEKYFEIVSYDDNNRPREIRQHEYDIKRFISPLSLYNNEILDGEGGLPTPFIIASGNSQAHPGDINDLLEHGYEPLK